MDTKTLIALLAVVAVAVLGLLMRRSGGAAAPPSVPPLPGTTGAATPAELDEDAEAAEGAVESLDVPLSLDGMVFIPHPHGVTLLSVVRGEETPEWLEKALDVSSVPYTDVNHLLGSRTAGERADTSLGTGDLTAARVVRGDSEIPWRLETLGRDGDFGFHPFATRGSAEAALHLLLDAAVVQGPVDEHGTRVPPSPEDFEEARRRYEKTLSELAMDGDPEPPREGQWLSDRR